MRIKIELACNKNIVLPCAYNAYLQAFVYTMLDPHAAQWLHSNGFELKEKQFRLFTFSGILERARRQDNNFVFSPVISFFVSSPVDWILEQVAYNSIKSSSFKLAQNTVSISSISILPAQNFDSEKITIQAITPIEVHTTFVTKEKRKKTYFFSPFEDEFCSRVNGNLQNKWAALFNTTCPHDITITPLFKGDRNKRIRSFVKDRGNPFRINGWMGRYKVCADPGFLRFAYDAGLGSGNSKGFGMFDVV